MDILLFCEVRVTLDLFYRTVEKSEVLMRIVPDWKLWKKRGIIIMPIVNVSSL